MQSQGQPEPSKIDRPTVLPEGTHMERREDGSVWQVTKAIAAHDKDGKEMDGPDTIEFRVDSVKDIDYIAKGGEPWYFKFIGESAGIAKPATDPAVAQILADLTARLDKAEARADAAEAKVEVAGPTPKPVVLPKPKKTYRSSKK